MVIRKTHIGMQIIGKVKQIIKIHELESGDYIKEFPYGTTMKLEKVDIKQFHQYTINYVKEYNENK